MIYCFYTTSYVVTGTLKNFSKNNVLDKYRIYQINAGNTITLCRCYKSN
jgi:hypothetical protein